MRTARLMLTRVTADDIDFAVDMYSRADVTRWIGDGTVETDRARTLARLERYASYREPTGVWVARTHDAAPVGFVLLKPIPWSADAPGRDAEPDIEIGWHLHPDHWGRGYATEAAEALVRHARASGMRRIVAVTHPDNRASQAVCHRIGMTPVGRSRAYYDTEVELFELHLGG